MPDKSVEITVLLPAYNEAEALPHVIADIRRAIADSYEIIVIDDGSTDETASVAQNCACRVLQYGENRGKGFAVRTGASYACGRYLVVMDADGTYPAEAIPPVVKLLKECDMVRCRRMENRHHIPLINRIGNMLFDQTLAIMHGLRGSDHLSGLYAFRMDSFRELQLSANGFDIEAEIGVKAQKKGFSIKTYPIEYHPRLGIKKLRPWKDGLKILNRIFSLAILFSPFAFFIFPSLILLLFSMIGAFFLNRGPIVTPYFGLSIHSFILANLGILGAFQLFVFGIIATLYGVEFLSKIPSWIYFFRAKPLRIGFVSIGLMLLLHGLFRLVLIVVSWLRSGAGLFFDTHNLIISATHIVWGLQIISTGLFLTIFSNRLGRRASDPRNVYELTQRAQY